MTNLKPVDVAIVGGRWSGLAMAKEITTRSGLNVVVLEKKLRPDMQSAAKPGRTSWTRNRNPSIPLERE